MYTKDQVLWALKLLAEEFPNTTNPATLDHEGKIEVCLYNGEVDPDTGMRSHCIAGATHVILTGLTETVPASCEGTGVSASEVFWLEHYDHHARGLLTAAQVEADGGEGGEDPTAWKLVIEKLGERGLL